MALLYYKNQPLCPIQYVQFREGQHTLHPLSTPRGVQYVKGRKEADSLSFFVSYPLREINGPYHIFDEAANIFYSILVTNLSTNVSLSGFLTRVDAIVQGTEQRLQNA